MNDRGAFEQGFAHIHHSGESTMHLTKCSPREPVANLAKRFGTASGTRPRSATRGHYVWQDCSGAASLRSRRHFEKLEAERDAAVGFQDH